MFLLDLTTSLLTEEGHEVVDLLYCFFPLSVPVLLLCNDCGIGSLLRFISPGNLRHSVHDLVGRRSVHLPEIVTGSLSSWVMALLLWGLFSLISCFICRLFTIAVLHSARSPSPLQGTYCSSCGITNSLNSLALESLIINSTRFLSPAVVDLGLRIRGLASLGDAPLL